MKQELQNLIAKRKSKIIACEYSKKHFSAYDCGKFYHSLEELKKAVDDGIVNEKYYNSVKHYYDVELDDEIKKLQHEIDIIENWIKEIKEND